MTKKMIALFFLLLSCSKNPLGNESDSSVSNQFQPGLNTSYRYFDSSWTPQWASVVGYWGFNGSGSLTNSATVTAQAGGAAANAVVTGSGLTYTTGQLDQAVQFNASAYLVVPDADQFDNTSRLSISFWTYPTTADGVARGYICKRVDSTTGQAYCIFNWTGNKVYVDFDASNDRFSSNTALAMNTWYHIVVTYDGTQAFASRAKIYINGVLDQTSSETSTSIPNYASDIAIGKMPAQNASTARIDEVAIWNTTLTAAEVLTIYNRQR